MSFSNTKEGSLALRIGNKEVDSLLLACSNEKARGSFATKGICSVTDC